MYEFCRDEKHKEAERNLLDLIDEAKRQCEVDRQSVVQSQKVRAHPNDNANDATTPFAHARHKG